MVKERLPQKCGFFKTFREEAYVVSIELSEVAARTNIVARLVE